MKKNHDYKGIMIEYDLDVPPVFAHGDSLGGGTQEVSHNIPYFRQLMKSDYASLPEEWKTEVSGLYSLVNMNDQMKHGGIYPYFFNRFHEAGNRPGKLIPHCDQSGQYVAFMRIICFLSEFQDFQDRFQKMTEVAYYFNRAGVIHIESEEDSSELLEVYDYEGGFDNLYAKVLTAVEWGIELYAQYLVKQLREAEYEFEN